MLALSVARDLIAKSNYSPGDVSSIGEERTTTIAPNSPLIVNGGTRFRVKVGDFGTSWNTEWIQHKKGKSKKSKTTLACTRLLENHVYDNQMKFLVELFSKAMADSFPLGSNFLVLDFDIPCFTEIKVVKANGTEQIFRGHPAYRGQEPWHDWVNVRWRSDKDGTFSAVPAEIQFFVHVTEEIFPFARFLHGYRGEGTYALIQSMAKETRPHGTSSLLSRGVREKGIYHLQKVDTLLDPAFIVDNIGCPRQSLLVLTPRTEWASLFL
jgi:hypothetical protein